MFRCCFDLTLAAQKFVSTITPFDVRRTHQSVFALTTRVNYLASRHVRKKFVRAFRSFQCFGFHYTFTHFFSIVLRNETNISRGFHDQHHAHCTLKIYLGIFHGVNTCFSAFHLFKPRLRDFAYFSSTEIVAPRTIRRVSMHKHLHYVFSCGHL